MLVWSSVCLKAWQGASIVGRAVEIPSSCLLLTIAMSSDPIRTALATLGSLEDRLRRVEWYLSGSDDVANTLQQVASQGKDSTVQARLAKLENNLQRLSTRSPDVNELLRLRQSASLLAPPLLKSQYRRDIP